MTGAARGIGRATVERFGAEGAKVVAVDRAFDEGWPTQRGVRTVEAVVTDVEAIGRAADMALESGRLDICVANAGIGRVESFMDGSPASWREVLEVNLIGVMVTLQAAAVRMIRDDLGGRLLATASVAAVRGEPAVPAYSASKGGVVALVRALAVELAPHGITANAVAPGQITTGLHRADCEALSRRQGMPVHRYVDDLTKEIPLGRLGEPEEVAGLFAFLASDDAAFISGATVLIAGAEVTI